MSQVFDCNSTSFFTALQPQSSLDSTQRQPSADSAQRQPSADSAQPQPSPSTIPALAAAAHAIARGEVVCLPTDTVYGIGADPRNSDAVTALLAAKSRTREMPPPVLVPSWLEVSQLTSWVHPQAQLLAQRFWPGALTMIFPANETLGWDLGETHGTVAVRIPDHPVARALLETCGPLAVTSANKTGQPPATNVQEAQAQLGDAVSVYLDGGTSRTGVPSTIVKFMPQWGDAVQIIRSGAIAPNDLLAGTTFTLRAE